MNYILSIFTTFILVYLIFCLYKTWKLRMLLSPALYFAATWLFGSFGCVILYPSGLFYDPYPQYINELNIFVSFTSLTFIFLNKKGRSTINDASISLNICSFDVFRFLSSLLLLSAIYEFISLGGNLNMGAARENVHQIVAQRSVLVNYASTLALPLSLYAGFKLAKALVEKNSNSRGRVSYLLFPLFANLILSIDVGGRVDVIFSFIMYLMGMAFYLPTHFNLKDYKKPIIISVISSLIVIIFISSVATQRNKNGGYGKSEIETYLEKQSPILATLYGPIGYVVSTYTGYQLRRVDAVDESKKGFGIYTFNGFINWTLPFSNQIGLGDISIAKMADVYYSNNETYDEQRELYNVTFSAYLNMVKDFGFWGAFPCIVFLCIIAHFLFIKIQRREIIKSALSLYWFALFWTFFSRSVFVGSLSSSILIPLYGYLIIAICNHGKKTT